MRKAALRHGPLGTLPGILLQRQNRWLGCFKLLSKAEYLFLD
jgi:hypothetical protein